jgi:DNA repair protein RadA/Sms
MRLKEAAKLGFGRAILPESARGEAGSDAGLSLNAIGGLSSLVADIAARGTPRAATKDRDIDENGGTRATASGKNASLPRFRRQDS